jgi:H+/Cl- antiporter ClcA
LVKPWLIYASIAAIWAFLGGAMTTYYGPAANGSGVAEVIGYLNGVNYPGFMQINTLLTKIMGVTFAVSAKLCVGKEGPLAHIGSIIGVGVLYLPFGFEHLQNDEIKRVFCAAGASCGVSCAFGAPIGGALFCYELSKPNTFWKFQMIWKVFFACCLGTFTLAVLTGIQTGNYTDWSGAQIKFGVQDINELSKLGKNVSIIRIIPSAIILGIEGGILGSLFINVNTRVNALRAKLLTSQWMKPIETAFFGFLSASVFFIVPYIISKENCQEEEIDVPTSLMDRGWCSESEKEGRVVYNPTASIFWASEGDIIKAMIASTFD